MSGVMMDSWQEGIKEAGFSQPKVGKVRDTYDLGDGRLLMVTTDRISTYDVVHPNGIPDKGRVLTSLTDFWLMETADLVDNHTAALPSEINHELRNLPEAMEGRTSLVWKAEPIMVECIVRGYLTGSGWVDYQKTGSVCGVGLPVGIVESQELPEPIFTPTTKETTGHDQPITFAEMADKVGGVEVAEQLRAYSVALYTHGRDIARRSGIIIADTKFEFGWLDGEIILIDEALTPDSSRFWPADQYEPGRSQPSFDKQFVRDYVTSIGWDKQPPAPHLPTDIVEQTAEKYREACERLTGEERES